MAKDFTQWHEVKSLLEAEASNIHFYEREVWLASLGANLGREEDGKHEKFLRPIIIVKKFNRDQFWGVPLTSTIKSYPHYYPIEIDGRHSSALLHQMRSLDRKRLFQRMNIISEIDFINIREKLVALLDSQKQNPSLGGDLQLTSQPSGAEAIVDSS